MSAPFFLSVLLSSVSTHTVPTIAIPSAGMQTKVTESVCQIGRAHAHIYKDFYMDRYLDFLDYTRRSIVDAEADDDRWSLSVPLTIQASFHLKGTFSK